MYQDYYLEDQLKKNIEENKAKIKALLENIKHHEFFSILQNSLDFSNPTNEPY